MKKNSAQLKDTSKDTLYELPLTKTNYLLILGGIAVIVLGLFILSIDDFVDAQHFSTSLYVAPLVIMAGFVAIIFAIMFRSKA